MGNFGIWHWMLVLLVVLLLFVDGTASRLVDAFSPVIESLWKWWTGDRDTGH